MAVTRIIAIPMATVTATATATAVVVVAAVAMTTCSTAIVAQGSEWEGVGCGMR
jgi:hypothetical protein